MKKSLAGLCVAALAVGLAGGGIAWSQESGLAEIHAWVKVGRKTCMLDHYHDGSGNGPTRPQAERAAVRAWVEFTAWEYGSQWGSYAIAASKTANCSRGDGGWSCAVQARPCRPY